MLLSYKNDENLKTMLLEEIRKHEKADAIIQGTYGEKIDGKWKGCAVGCSIRSLNIRLHKRYSTSDHSVYEKELGIPEWLARLEDTIFEGLPKEEAKLWPRRFTQAIPVGVNLEPIKWKFCAFILQENIERVLTLEIADDLKKQVVDAIRQVLAVHEEAIKTGSFNESAARSAASAAWSAESAAWSAESAASAAWSAESAAWSAESAASAAWSAESAARSAASAASAARSAASAASAANKRYADKLIFLLEQAK